MSNELTREDVDVLIESVEAWEQKDAMGDMMGDMLVASLSRNEDDRRKLESDMESRRSKKAAEKRLRKERSILLRAKLIAIRDSADADAMLADVQR